MIVEVKQKTPDVYPCIRIKKDIGLIVLFLKYGEGIILQRENNFFPTWYYINGCEMSHYEIFEGEITIKNK